MNKKQYLVPSMDIEYVQPMLMLATSGDTLSVNNEYEEGEALVKGWTFDNSVKWDGWENEW